ncbi:sensor histidine kinase [Heyndrickxia acidicola]|uniref:histidine kinase n=1 Tax=Heyndrickxia acidicola TaxID=209389 RepID=A0ABU6MC55_9BACI|nr:sensor histidine kinase [Heyndrickxia acidicola]MED1202257.1 sensor histidine kinase [Heyndrickxia acidicola]
MDLGMVMTKLIIIFFIAYSYINSSGSHKPWIVFALLVYLSINLVFYLVKEKKMKELIAGLTVLFVIYAFVKIDSLILLLIPINLYELLNYYTKRKWFLLVAAFIPMVYIGKELQPVYALVSFFGFTIFTGCAYYSGREEEHEKKMDEMRKSIQRLSSTLTEKNIYMRQSEYTYKLEERNRLSQEIHDKIGHSITGALIQMEAAKRLLNRDADKAKELLQNAINISKEGIEKIRLTLRNMKPPVEQIGVHRIKLVLDEFSSQSHMRTSLVTKGNLDVVTPFQWKLIQENVTEALTNSSKYSDADAVAVEIQVLNKAIKVEVKDNGRGTDKVIKGMGLMGMEERTASLNGKLIIDGTNGFSVTTLLPIP